MYIHIYAHLYKYTYAHKCRIYAYLLQGCSAKICCALVASLRLHTCIYTYINICIYIFMYIYIYIHTHTLIYSLRATRVGHPALLRHGAHQARGSGDRVNPCYYYTYTYTYIHKFRKYAYLLHGCSRRHDVLIYIYIYIHIYVHTHIRTSI